MPELDAERLRIALLELGIRSSASIVAGVSGGVDSVVLLRLLCDSGISVMACHANYGLRGAESDDDEEFVRALADELGIPVVVRRVDLPDAGNRQEAARDARYVFFREVAEGEGVEAVAVAHHQDDQAETVLLNLFRGAGPHGLSGMPAIRPIASESPIQLIRPLLSWSRAEIKGVAINNGWRWREDISNEAGTYARNRLRNLVMPLIEQEFGEHVSRNIAEAGKRIGAVVGLVDEKAIPRLVVDELRDLPKSQRHALYISALKQFAPRAPRRSEALTELDALLDAQPGKHVVWPGGSVWRERDALVIKPDAQELEEQSWTVQVGGSVTTPSGILAVEPVDCIPTAVENASADIEFVDASMLREPLELRYWRDSDRFNPLGLGGSKLVSDLLTDLKVPPSERERQLVLCSSGKIIWVVGHRLTEEFRLNAATVRAVRLAWTPSH